MTENKKLMYLQYNIGKVKYAINYHNGVSTYKDGSPFYGIMIFSNKKKFETAQKELVNQGYTWR